MLVIMKRNSNEYVTREPRLPIYRPQGAVAKLRKPRQLAVLFPVNYGRIDGVANFELPGTPARPHTANVRELRASDFGDPLKDWVAHDAELATAIALRDALNSGDKEAMAKAVQRAADHLLPLHNLAPQIRQEVGKRLAAHSRKLPDVARHLLAYLVSVQLTDARFVLWWKDAESYFVPAVYCPDERTALFAWALCGIVADSGEKLGVCPRCGTIFVGRSDQTYCSFRCASAYRMARMRKRQAKSQSSGGKR